MVNVERMSKVKPILKCSSHKLITCRLLNVRCLNLNFCYYCPTLLDLLPECLIMWFYIYQQSHIKLTTKSNINNHDLFSPGCACSLSEKKKKEKMNKIIEKWKNESIDTVININLSLTLKIDQQ